MKLIFKNLWYLLNKLQQHKQTYQASLQSVKMCVCVLGYFLRGKVAPPPPPLIYSLSGNHPKQLSCATLCKCLHDILNTHWIGWLLLLATGEWCFYRCEIEQQNTHETNHYKIRMQLSMYLHIFYMIIIKQLKLVCFFFLFRWENEPEMFKDVIDSYNFPLYYS